jgi:adenylate kinase
MEGKRSVRTRIVLLGPPASGKGTQAELIKERYRIEPTSTGAMLREELRRGTELGLAADQLTSRGQLVPDAMITELVGKWLQTHGDAFVFDGFPRTVPQAIELDRLLAERQTPLQAVIFFNVPFAEIRDRVLNRVGCQDCGHIFKIGLQVASIADQCPSCGGPLCRRSDDTIEALERRMVEYHEKTEPLIAFYRDRGLLFELKGAESPETVFAEISSILEAS